MSNGFFQEFSGKEFRPPRRISQTETIKPYSEGDGRLMKDFQAAVDVGGSKIYILLASAGETIASYKVETPVKTGPDTLLPFLADCVGTVLKEGGASLKNLSAVGLCIAGFFDTRDRVLVSSPNLPGWDRVDLEGELGRLLGVPVLVENDANAAALGEARFGAGRGYNDLVYVTVSTGIGAGIVSGGRIYRGSRGLAGELGHMTVVPDGTPCGCGRRGCLETVASGTAIANLAVQAGGSGNITAAHVFAAAARGDKTAAAVLDRSIYYLGLGLANTVNLLNPEALIIGGGVADAGEALLAPLRTAISRLAVPASAENLVVRKAELGVEAGVRGMLVLLGGKK
jgi:glucokinase